MIYTPIQPLDKYIVSLNGKYGFISSDTLEEISDVTFPSIEKLCNKYLCDVNKYTKHGEKEDTVDVDGLLNYIGRNYMLLTTLTANNKASVINHPDKIKQALSEVVAMQFENRFNKDLPAEIKLDYERRVLLGVIDRTWINHIDAMQKLRNGIYLRAYAQRDPLQEYTEEAFYMFEQMTSSIAEDISRNIVHMGIRPGSEEEAEIPALKIELSFK